MPSISAAGSSVSTSAAGADLDNLPAPLLIALLRSSYRRSQFDDVSEILAAREKSAAAADSRCADLERQLKDEKDRYAQLETKHGAVEESAEKYKRVTELLHECQVILEAENAALRARVQQGQERIAQLQEQLQSTEMSKFVELKVEVQDYKCGKRRAEEEAQDWKRKYSDAQAQVLALKVKAAAAENEKGKNLSMGGTSRGGADICDGEWEVQEVEEEEQNGPELMGLSSAGDVATSSENSKPVQAPEDDPPVVARGEEEGGGGAGAHPHCLIVISDSEEEDHRTVGNGNSHDSMSVCGGNADAAGGDGAKCGENITPVSTQRTEGDPPIANRGEEDDDEDDTVPLVELMRKRMSDVASPEPNSPNKTQSGIAPELKRKRMSDLASPEPNSPNKTQPNSPNKTQSGITWGLKRKRMSGLASPEPNSPNKMQSGTASELKRKRMSDVASPEPNSPNKMQSGTTSELNRKMVSHLASPELNSPNETESRIASVLNRKRMSYVIQRSSEPNAPNQMQSSTTLEPKMKRMADVFPRTPEPNAPSMHSGTASSAKFTPQQLEKRRKILTPVAIYGARRP